jgi:putative tryptophan/tyrosine transport system substrate-binding protein
MSVILGLWVSPMRRRESITLVGGGAAAWPLTTHAQQPDLKVRRVGLLTASPPTSSMLNAFRDGMREHGYIEGRNLSVVVRWPHGSFDQDPGIEAELVSDNVDVIVAWTTPAVIAARRATATIPIVMVSVGDPVGSGFIASLARPGGNVTGVSNIAADLSAKLIELFVELVPGMKRIGVVRNLDNPNVILQLQETEEAIRKLNMQVQVVDARTPDEFERAFARLSAESVNGVVLLANAAVIKHSQRIAEIAQALQLPTAFQRRENVEAGGLLSYGANLNDQFRQAAFYVDRILKGAKPAELPVEQPNKFELVINLKTARALGLKIPQTLLVAADEVIE